MKKKARKYAEGGLAGIAQTAKSLMDTVDSTANQINYGSFSGANPALGFNSLGDAVSSGSASSMAPGNMITYGPVNPPGQTYQLSQRPGRPDVALFGFKKGGSVKASKATKAPKTTKAPSASKRADGIATKGKTKGRFV
jgi:hypothetical protein